MKFFYSASLLFIFLALPYALHAEESDPASKSESVEQQSCQVHVKKAAESQQEESFWDIYQQRSGLATFLISFFTTQATIGGLGLIIGGLVGYASHDLEATKFCGIVGGLAGAYIGHRRLTPSIARTRWDNFIIDAATKLNMSEANQAFNVNIKQNLDASQLSANAATNAAKDKEMRLSKWGSWAALALDGVILASYILYRLKNG